MKKIKKILFSMLLLCVGIISVKAADPDPVNVSLWNSIVTDITANAGGNNNCILGLGEGLIDTFIVGNDCVATAISVGDSYLLVGRAGTDDVDGATYQGATTASVNDTSNTDVLLSEIVELIYNNNSNSTKKLKAFALSQTRANGATSYVLKAGSSNNALYVYGGYEGKTMSGIKLNFDNSNKKLSYTITLDATNEDEFYLAVYFTRYLIDYIMEASPNYDSAISIVTTESKLNLIKSEFVNRYGEVRNYTDPALKIEVNVFAKGDINNQIVNLYDAAVAANANPGQNTGNNGNQNEDDGDNPNTGAFVNIFAIVSLISVGTVLILGKKRKLFRI